MNQISLGRMALIGTLCIIPVITEAQNTGIGTLTPTDQLHTTGTVRFEGYRGPGNRIVQLDSSGRMIVSGAGAVNSATPNTAITDNGCSAGNGVSSGITVTGMATAVASSKISVRVNIGHTNDADLRILLVSPSSAVLTLASGNGGAGHNFYNTIFTDGAATSISTITVTDAPFTNKYKPLGSMATQCLTAPTVPTFAAIGNGTVIPNGTWTLKVYDATTGNTGTLYSWDISFSGPESFLTAEQNNYVPEFSSGNLVASNIYQQPASGNIGIRTNSPQSTLHVSDQTNTLLTLESTSALSASSTVDMAFKNGAYYTGLIRTRGLGTNVSALSFYTFASPAVGSLDERLTILDNGNVGIGNTNPLYNLDVTGTQHVSGATNLAGTLQVQGGAPAANRVLTSTNASGNATWHGSPINTGFLATAPGTQLIASNSNIIVGFSSTGGPTAFDDGGGWSNTNSNYVVPESGVYLLEVTVGFTGANYVGNVQGMLRRNGNTTYPLVSAYQQVSGTGNPGALVFSSVAKLAAGDVVDCYVYQNASSYMYITGLSQFSGVRLY